MSSNIVWFVDTSIMCNLLEIPGMDSEKDQIFDYFKQRLERRDYFLLPYSVILETGNHIGHARNNREELVRKFLKIINKTLEEELPWKILKIPNIDDFKRWLSDFPQHAYRGLGYGDFSIFMEWDEYRKKHGALDVRIWTLDGDLHGFD